jgi:pentapeptide MXKDX repeat protein
MKTNLLTAAIAAAAIVGLSGAALAQTTGPAAQDNTKMNKDMSKDSMSKDGMKAGDSNMAPTTGANTSPSQKPMTTPAQPAGKESNSETPKR